MSIVNNTTASLQPKLTLPVQPQFARRPVSVLEQVEQYFSAMYDLRYNEVKNRVEIKAKDAPAYIEINDRKFNTLLIQLNKSGVDCKPYHLESFLTSELVPTYDPFLTYFQNLPKWNEEMDYIAELAETVETSRQDYWKNAFTKWIVGVVACALEAEKSNHQVLVLCGAQGVGKSTWLNSLLPEALKGYLFSGTIDPNNRDSQFRISENLLVNLDELENLNRSELGSLKSLITTSSIKARRVYGKYDENFIRRASFMGSVNGADFLTDTTGNRRYLCFMVEDIHRDILIDMDNVFAQAYAYYQGGFKYWFEGEEIQEINRHNEEFVSVSLEEEMVRKYFEAPSTGKKAVARVASEVMAHINNQEKGKVYLNSVKKIGSVLVKLGYTKKTQGGQKCFQVYEKSPEEIAAEKER